MPEPAALFPRVTLDRTFADLYGDKKDSLILSTQMLNRYVDAQGGGHPKYYYHDMAVADKSQGGEGTRRDILDVYMRGQRNTFVCGNMLVLTFFSGTPNDPNDDKLDIMCTMNGLNLNQQPRLAFCCSPKPIKLPRDKLLVPALPVDCISQHRLLIDPDIHYVITSKRGLALSGLPNPKSNLLDFETRGQATEDEKSLHAEKVLRVIQEHELPFAVKLQQTISGYGTFIINSENTRVDAIAKLKSILPSSLSKVAPKNINLHPATVIVSELTPSDGSIALSFFVKPDGEVFFISGSWQNFEDAHHYDGCCINYSEQDKFRDEVSGLLDKVAKFVYDKGYYGPIGLDVLKSKSTGELIVVDLNARPCASHVVGLLRGHFEKRGLQWACLKEMVKVPFTRKEFFDVMREEIASGRLVIVAWCEDKNDSGSWGSFVLGAESKEVLIKDVQRLQEINKPTSSHSSGLFGFLRRLIFAKY
jgi:hypothetical protein